MKGILPDVNVAGTFETMVQAIFLSTEWAAFWKDLSLQVATFQEYGMDPDSPDDDVWHLCQREGFVLFTGNRTTTDRDRLKRPSWRSTSPTACRS